MSLTRRSFIKKSSYSAAAVTAFGTGIGLATNLTSGPKMDFVWQRSSHGNQTIEVGPYTSEPQAISELRKKMKKDLMNTNIIQVPNPQDVPNMSQITRVYTWVNGAQGAEIAIKTEKKNGKWYASLHIPGGVYHITFYE